MSDGVLYIAFGERCVAEARHSVASVRRHCTGLATTLFADRDVPPGAFDSVRRIEPSHKRAKVDYIHESPHERTLYLDSDTRVVGDLRDIFRLLDSFDVAACHDFARKRRRFSDSIPEYGAIPYGFSEVNGGLLLFRRNAGTTKFFELWRDLFRRYREVTRGWDQATLRVALWQSGVRLYVLPPEYNVRSQGVRNRVGKLVRSGAEPWLMRPRVLHWHGLHEEGPLRRLLSNKYRPYRF